MASPAHIKGEEAVNETQSSVGLLALLILGLKLPDDIYGIIG